MDNVRRIPDDLKGRTDKPRWETITEIVLTILALVVCTYISATVERKIPDFTPFFNHFLEP